MPMSDFKHLVDRTYCPFAKPANIWYGPDWDKLRTFDTNVERIGTELHLFALRGREGMHHGFVSEIFLGSRAGIFDEVKKAFFAFLKKLGAMDPSCAKSLAANFMSTDWQFEYSEVRMFLNVFAPCYKAPHSKYVDTRGEFFVFFQPEYSFDLCGIGPQSQSTKIKIRSTFANAGMPYNGDQIDRRVEALLYMFPQQPFGEPVKWWE